MNGYTVYKSAGCYEARAVCVPVADSLDLTGVAYKLYDTSQGQYLETSDEDDIAQLVTDCAATDAREAAEVVEGVRHLSGAPGVAVVVVTGSDGLPSATAYPSTYKAETACVLASDAGPAQTPAQMIVIHAGDMWTWCPVTHTRLVSLSGADGPVAAAGTRCAVATGGGTLPTGTPLDAHAATAQLLAGSRSRRAVDEPARLDITPNANGIVRAMRYAYQDGDTETRLYAMNVIRAGWPVLRDSDARRILAGEAELEAVLLALDNLSG